jgi:uncharacterized membrane protein YtjA (UPF0391 family)
VHRVALWCFVLALLSALLGYGWVGGLQLEPARLLFFALLALAVVLFVANFLRGTPPDRV